MEIERLIKKLQSLNRHENGKLIVHNDEITWHLHVIKGELLYCSDIFHPVRRWDRALKQHGSKWDWNAELLEIGNHPLWECQMLDRGISHECLSLIRAKLLIRTVFLECLFELGGEANLKYDWELNSKTVLLSNRSIGLSSWELQTIAHQASRIQQQWQLAGLGHLRPSFAPVLRQKTPPPELPLSVKYLQGQFTLWDIAWQLEKSIVELAQGLAPQIEQGMINLQKIPDLQLPNAKYANTLSPTSPAQPLKKATLDVSTQTNSLLLKRLPLIACIDDSPVLAHTLSKILVPAGYQVLSIQEPMRGFTQLIEHKPDLILLDLLLPNADGYSVCKFLRETPVFENTPIIILTARNTEIDRIRAKLAGATEFLGKPPIAEELLPLLEKFLAPKINS